MRFVHSYSSIKKFKDCPKMYYHRYVAKDAKDTQSEASLHGDRVHKALELRVRDSTPLTDGMGHYESVARALDKSKAEGKVVTPEKEYALTRSFKPTGWWDKDAWLRAKLDVTVLGGKKAAILDYKTGKRRVNFDQLKFATLTVLDHEPDVESVAASYIWLQTGEIDTEVFTREEDYDKIQDKIIEDAGRIEEAYDEDVWPAKPGWACMYCPAKDICQYAEKGRSRW